MRYAILLLVLAVGCKSKAEKAIEAHKPKLAKQVAAIESFAKVTFPKPEERVTAPPEPLVRIKDGPNNNLIVVPTESLGNFNGNPGRPLFVYADYYDATRFLDPKLNSRGLTADEVDVKSARFEGIKYALIVKTSSVVEPDLVPNGGKNGADVYKQGAYHGEAHLYGLDGKRYGGFSFGASSSFAVNYSSTGQGDIGSEIGSLSQDFHKNIQEALDAAIAKSIPGIRTK